MTTVVTRHDLEPSSEESLHQLTATERDLYARIPAEIDFVPDDRFASPSMEEELYGDDECPDALPAWRPFGAERPEEPIPPPPSARPDRRREERLFLRYNYAKHWLADLIAAQKRRVSIARARAMIAWHQRVVVARAVLARSNLALIVAAAKRTPVGNVEFCELVAEGNVVLLRAIEKFDVTRGFRFSTYVWSAVMRRYSRLASLAVRHRSHFPVEFDPDLEHSDDHLRRHEMRRKDSLDALRELLVENRAELSRAERTIVMERFGIDAPHPGKTLAEVGRMLGLTPERIRQIQNAAIAKIRAILQ